MTLEKFVDVRAATLASKIRVVRGRNEADGFGRTSEEVARGVGERLQLVRLEADVIMHNIVVRRPRGSLKSAVCCKKKSVSVFFHLKAVKVRVTLQEEVKVVDRGDSAVNDGARLRVSVLVSISFLRWVEASVMTFALRTSDVMNI